MSRIDEQGYIVRLLLMSVCLWIGVDSSSAADPGDLSEQDARVALDADAAAEQAVTLLRNRCVKCHGAEAREGGLRLLSQADLLTRNDSGAPAVVAGNGKDSELIQRVETKDEDVRMPPEGDPLTAQEVRLLRRWIESGAGWPDSGSVHQTHWAYQRPVRPPVPSVALSSQVQNPVDAFVLSALESQDIPAELSSREEPARLLRRVYLDLSGVPPAPADVDAFVRDPSSRHYEQIVQQLLDSPRYGEKWARSWLDLARYADSNGYQADQFRSVWAYRDWVIDALNADMPFDQFTIEQLAGDLLPEPAVSQRIATGFHRLTTCNVEAGVDPEENRTNQVADRVNTTGTVWLGTTLECARCHNHKYDPFSQQDYYQLFAFFNNTPLEVEPPSNGGVQYEVAGPAIQLPLSSDMQQRSDRLQNELAEARRAEADRQAVLSESDMQWEQRLLDSQSSASTWHLLNVADFRSSGGAEFRRLEDGSILVTGRQPDKDVYTLTIETPLAKITGLKLEALTHETLPGSGPGRTDSDRPNFVLYEVETSAAPLKRGGSEQSSSETVAMPVRFVRATADFAQAKWDPAGLIDGKPNTGWAIAPEFHKDHEVVLLTESAIGFDGGTRLTIRLPQTFGRGRTMGRLRFSALTGDPTAVSVPDSVVAVLKLAPEKRTVQQRELLRTFRIEQDALLVSLKQKIESLEQQLQQIAPQFTAVMMEMEQPRESFIFRRGDFLSRVAEVQPATPAVLHPLSVAADVQPLTRLDLARWLVSDQNPLTARVTVNRWWAEFFGRGIVATLEDFGTQGSPPSHPDLLDWLAVEFMQHDWSMKHVHRLIVLSATYQQSSRLTPEMLERDPLNIQLTRAPRIRLSAEQIRDNALAISGLLSEKRGGPPVYPPQPDNIWRHVGRNAPKYETDQDEDRFRRGIYVVWRRSAPYPSFVNFDAPDRASCVVSRSRSNTPLQALTLMNDPAYVEMAAGLAARIVREAPNGSLHSRIEHAFRLCVARTPSTEEVLTLADLWKAEAERFADDPGSAKKLIGKQSLPPGVALNEQAAWFSVANVMLNLDETITKN